jgi:hypothetical protein
MEGKELHQQLLYKSTVWPINPASSRNRSHRLLGGGEFTGERMRVVTAFEPDKQWKIFYFQQRAGLQ